MAEGWRHRPSGSGERRQQPWRWSMRRGRSVWRAVRRRACKGSLFLMAERPRSPVFASDHASDRLNSCEAFGVHKKENLPTLMQTRPYSSLRTIGLGANKSRRGTLYRQLSTIIGGHFTMIVPRITYPVPSLITFLSSAGMLANFGMSIVLLSFAVGRNAPNGKHT